MTELLPATRDALLKVQTSTLTGALYRRGLRNMFMQDVNPLRIDQPRMVGIAFTMRFIPAREDKNGPGVRGQAQIQPRAMEECPPGHVLVIEIFQGDFAFLAERHLPIRIECAAGVYSHH